MSRGSIMLTAGGTGGHLFPAQALCEELIRRGYEVDLITDTRGNVYGVRFSCAQDLQGGRGDLSRAVPHRGDKDARAAWKRLPGLVPDHG